ncbi:MAG: hypothetical protein P4L42_09720 [Desulfocapsaceae bacterium]|nr:hypothetical protein [Desulfocapsaceae bacterium]
MKNLFHDILDMDGVHGLVLLSENGTVLFESPDSVQFRPQRSMLSWKSIIDLLGDFQEMNLIFELGRCYLRQTENGYLAISMGPMVSMAMIKLSCDIILPQLKKTKTGGFRSFFRR